MAKRAFDLVVAIAAMVVTAPLSALVALGVRIDSAGPVLHRATRIGKDGEPFTLYKFRTMVFGAAGRGPGVTGAGDDRITRVGRALRRSKLDELPQLVNVFRGDMSVVGPRPEDPRYVAGYTTEQREVLRVRPGLVSPAVVAYRDEERLLAGAADVERVYLEQVLPEKLRLDLHYVRTRSFTGDLIVLARAASAVARPGRALERKEA